MDNRYDIVIVSHEMDFNKIKYVLEYANKYLDFDEIHLILSERSEFKEKDILDKLNKPVFYHDETDILKIDKSKIAHRPNWVYQMLLKFFQNVTKNDNYLVIESDVIINKKIEFFNNNKTNFYLGVDQYHIPYFDFSKKLMGLGREYNHSFISEFMMYNKNIIKDLLNKCNCETPNDFVEKIYDLVNSNCYLADYELYGNFCYKYHKDKYDFVKINSSLNGKSSEWSDDEIRNLINVKNQYDVISFHTWKSHIKDN